MVNACRCVCMVLSALPEMHVWIGIPQTGELVDFSCWTISSASLKGWGSSGTHLTRLTIPVVQGRRLPDRVVLRASDGRLPISTHTHKFQQTYATMTRE